MKMKKLTKKECLEIGGHFWKEYNSGDIVDDDAKYLYTISLGWAEIRKYRMCRVCGTRERQIPAKWEEIESKVTK
jgi:hypothetical protein